MDEAIYLGFVLLELSKIHMYETYYDELQPIFGLEKIQLHYIDTDAFVLSMNTKNIIKDFKKLEVIIVFSTLDKNHELFSNKNKNVIGEFIIETLKKIWIDEFIDFGSKKYWFKCRVDGRNKLKGISKSQSKHIKSKEDKKCLDEEEF